MTEAIVDVRDLRKTFKVHEREAGLGATIRGVFRRRFRDVNAVAGITFRIEPGEVVGFLGPNGAGKTTALKMLSGLLNPTAGEARVLGYVPWHRENAYLRRMTLLIGNRSQLQWDIPAADSLQVLKEIYGLSADRYRATLGELTELLSLGDLLHKPVRNLSLGERMKVEFAAGLIQSPEVAFLDEPTIGLDVSMQSRIRQFVGDHNRRTGATILLTSHYMADVVALCKRVVIIHHGRILYDGALATLADEFAAYKTIGVVLENGSAPLDAYGEVVHREGDRVSLRVPKLETSRVAARLLADHDVLDLTIEEPPIEDVIESVFARPASA